MKGFSASKCDVGNRTLSKSKEFFENLLGNFLDFLGEFFSRIFRRNFLGDIFWENFCGMICWEELFGRNYLVEINNELMLLSRFLGNSVSMEKEGRKNFQSLEVRLQVHRT